MNLLLSLPREMPGVLQLNMYRYRGEMFIGERSQWIVGAKTRVSFTETECTCLVAGVGRATTVIHQIRPAQDVMTPCGLGSPIGSGLRARQYESLARAHSLRAFGLSLF